MDSKLYLIRFFKAIRSIKREKTKSQLDKLTRYVHWSQQLLTERDISYTRLTDFVDSKFAGKFFRSLIFKYIDLDFSRSSDAELGSRVIS